ncbi:hypothetical protein TSUD_361490 [Trifolium subterraneum]|uniref:Uncharacterized protein n=1 Tax=Trifolium subterraneum TaxID=3900 RepID=A0A2Z6M3T2_TRISU|nr:hypothetical protein TSUD_361490 [Trifolium subterraneum]
MVSSNSEAEGRHVHDDGDLFSDGKTDSDISDSYQMLLGTEGDRGKKSMVVVGSEESICGGVGRGKAAADPILLRLVVVEAKGGSEFPFLLERDEDLDVRGLPKEVEPNICVVSKGDSDVLGKQERVLEVRIDQVDGSVGMLDCGPFECGPIESHENPFEVLGDQGEVGLAHDPTGVCVEQFVSTQCCVPGGHLICDVAGEIIRENGGVVLSDVSSSSQGVTKEIGNKYKKKKNSRNSKSDFRPLIPTIGTPLSRKIAMKAARRRQQDGCSTKAGSSKRALISYDMEDVSPEIDLHVELPIQRSGIDLLVDNSGVFVPDSISVSEGGSIDKEGEASGFHF